jgi:membrane protein YdbS with pleckstrin-like domain
MFNPVRSALLAFFKVPPEPHPPSGSPGSLRVFRAGKNYFNLRLFGWGFGQLFALAGIVFWVYVFIVVEAEVQKRRETEQPATLPTDAASLEEFVRSIAAASEAPDKPASEGTAAGTAGTPAIDTAGEPVTTLGAATEATEDRPGKGKRKVRVRIEGWNGFKRALVEIGLRLPPAAIPVLWALKIVGIVIYLVQIPVTYFLRRLDYEMRWYMVTDRSLRLRWGVAKVQETTMSFANLQQVELLQNPIQRLLGLGDVRVQSAGGGSGGNGEKDGADSMHRAHFHAVDNAQEIRDLILERLRRFRQTGLGDPDEHHHEADHAGASHAPQPGGSTLGAAREVLAEARALRSALR